MKGNPGDLIVCISAPWHESNPSTPCGIKQYGPKQHEVVTIDFLLMDEEGMIHFRLKEYPDDPMDANRFAGFRNDFFEALMSDSELEKLLPIEYETRKN